MSFCTDSISALSASDFISGFDLSTFALNMCANDSDLSKAQ